MGPADSNSQAVRNLFLDPNTPARVPTPDPARAAQDAAAEPTGHHSREKSVDRTLPIVSRGPAASSRSAMETSTDDEFPTLQGPLSARAVSAEKARQLLQRDVMLRPLRLLAIGKEGDFTPEDQNFLRFVKNSNAPLLYQSPCPKSPSTPSGRRYLRYMRAHTIREDFDLGATREDLKWDYRRGWISFPKHEPQLSGHVFNAQWS